jgi:hypothetical protein
MATFQLYWWRKTSDALLHMKESIGPSTEVRDKWFEVNNLNNLATGALRTARTTDIL